MPDRRRSTDAHGIIGALVREGHRPLIGIAALLCAAGLPATATATATSTAAAGPARTETPVTSAAPDAGSVSESYVSILAPLPAATPSHPVACERLGYLRFRSPQGPRSSAGADAVYVAMPGFLAGAASFDQVARHVVEGAARRGKQVEFWALDRRANCLEDHTGTRAAARARDPAVALGYYFRGREVDGRRFAGFKTPQQARFVADFGLERTLRDWYAVVTHELPSRRDRVRKLLCGGHSLGGPLTAAFAAWDFDGDPETRGDAGYNQCAGFFGLDTTLENDGPGGSPTGLSAVAGLAARSGALPYFDAPPATPETLQALPAIGIGAFMQPDRESSIPRTLPRRPKTELTLRLLFSRDAANFVTGSPSVRDIRITNEAVLGGVLDDNSDPVSILRASVGTFAGGPVADKNFPTPNAARDLLGSSVLVGGKSLMIPTRARGPLYRWRNYDELAGAPLQLDGSGRPYTSPGSEVTDIRQLARAQFEAPADFVEQYFPTRLFLEPEIAANDRSGEFRNLRYDGIGQRPALLVQAGDGIGADAPPPGKPGSVVTLPGYDHIDVTMAAARQNALRADGARRPEGSSAALVKFGCEVVGCAAEASAGSGSGGSSGGSGNPGGTRPRSSNASGSHGGSADGGSNGEQGGGSLPFTGFGIIGLAVLASLLVLGGGGLRRVLSR